ncbi:hypothetical protein Btru_003588 [Bulinus truncatus]|nr:hypothetical protein Btru_003588 [Bulinus truncatus]
MDTSEFRQNVEVITWTRQTFRQNVEVITWTRQTLDRTLKSSHGHVRHLDRTLKSSHGHVRHLDRTLKSSHGHSVQQGGTKNGILDGDDFHLFSEMSQRLTEMSRAPSFEDNDASLAAWLKNISKTLDRPEACTVLLSHLTSAVLVTATSDVVSTAALQVVTTIARVDPRQAPDFLPLLLYVMGRAKTPERRFSLLQALPGLATHKLCIPPVLKTILALGKSPDLKPISIRLMVLLWRQQDRCFPQLLQLITESENPSTYQVSLAKSAAILEICKYKPEQHGSDLLAPLSDILKVATTEQDTPISVMALQGLSKLCEAEVIDIMSLWTYLEETFVNETRPLVIREICHMLSLVPHLTVETEQYENFTRDSVSKLWHYSQSPNSVVCAAAYEALSHYSIKHFCVSYLPKSVTQDLYDQVELAAEQMKEGQDGKDPDSLDVDVMFPQIPASCFISILQSLTDPLSISAYKSLLQSLMTSEVSDLPRGVYFTSATKKNLASHGGKVVEKIPNFLLQQYNNCKQPGLRPGLAAGMLFCYDPPLEVGRDGKPRKHYVVRHGKTFLETFVTLLQEVPIQTSDWHRLSLLPQAWNSFMERLFSSLLESRKAELELQEKHGHISSTDLIEKTSVVWLIAREAIMDAIKTTSRGLPTAQGNSILALSSLALCLHKYVSGLSTELFKASQEKTEYIGHSHWLAMTYDTIMSFLDLAYIPKGNIHGICYQKSSSHDGGQPNTLCCAIARLAASQLVPLLVASDIDKIVHILQLFTSSLTNGQSALDSPVPAFCNGLALGMMLEGLFCEHFSEMTGSKGMLAVWKALSALEDITYSLGNGTGCIIGLSLAICAMCSDGKTESRVHATSVLEKLIPIWMGLSSEADCYQALTFTVATIATCVYSTNTLDFSSILPVIQKMKQVHQDQPESSGVSLSLGLITFSLSRLGVDTVCELRRDLITAWMNDVTKVDVPPSVKVSKLNGLFSIIGSEQFLFPVINSVVVRDEQVSEVISKVTTLVKEQNDLSLQNFSFWMLGHFYLSFASSGEDKCTSVPGSFSYLPDWSLLRAIYDFLLYAGKSVADSTRISLVDICLYVLNVKNSLPPVNWPLMLSPFMRSNNFGDTIKAKVLQVAIPQLQTSTSAVVFLSVWLTPPLYSTLQLSSKISIHLNMSKLISSLSIGVLQTYLERSCLPEFSRADNSCVQVSILYGLRDALAVKDPPAAVVSLLHDITAQLYHKLTDEFCVQLLQAMAECLCQLPDDLMDAVIAADFSDASTQIKGCFVRCHMVATGRQPLALLNYMIDASFNTDYWDHKIGMFLLVNCLVAYSKNKGENSSPSVRQQWLLELLGHTRTLVIGAKPLASTAPSTDKVIRYISNLVTAAVLSLTFPSYTGLDMWGLSPELFAPVAARDSEHCAVNSDTPLQSEVISHLSHLGNLYANLVRFLPSIISSLCSKQWEVCLTKVIDWIMVLSESMDTDDETRNILNASLMSLHNLPVFRSVSIWTKVIQLTCRQMDDQK